jgi:D-alanine-D-alanine ligase
MKIGITYDLRQYYLSQGMGEEETAEFDSPVTIESIDSALRELGHTTDRIGNIKNLTSRLSSGDHWDLVFNIAEGIRGFGREAQVPALLEAYDIPYTFSDPLVLSLTLHKGMTKHVIRDLGIPTADFALVESTQDISRINLPFPLLAKPVAEGSGKGIDAASKITDPQELVCVCERLLETYQQPVLVERFLPGREFTVGILGTGQDARSIGVIEVNLNNRAEPDVYSYHNKEKYENLVSYTLVDDDLAKAAERVALAAWIGLGCRDAGRLDLRCDEEGIPNFIEVNPLAGINPDRSDLCIIAGLVGIGYLELIDYIVSSAMSRVLPYQQYRKGAVHG